MSIEYQEINTSQVFAADGDDQIRSCRLDVQPGIAELDKFAENFEATSN